MIEIMIVVAIIGMLAVIGIPQYAKFRSKARQAEAKTNLAGIYAAARTFKYEWDTYTNNLINLGFGVEGKELRYIIGFISDVPCANTVGYLGPPEGANTSDLTWTNNIAGPASNSANATWLPGLNFNNYATAVGSVCDQANFTALAVGETRNPGPITLDLGSATSGDRWSINQNKNLQIIHQSID